MKIHTADFRVAPGKKVDLKKWPAHVRPFYRSKHHYKEILAEHKDKWKGTVLLIGQPAEEKIGGAKAMLGDGLYSRFPKPNFALALHVTHDLETGKLAYTRGPAMASSTSLDILVRGKGGHGAMPQNTVDPIVIAARTILAWQTIISREGDPQSPAVLTVGAIQGGTKNNIIPDQVQLLLSVRTFDSEVRKRVLKIPEVRRRLRVDVGRQFDKQVTDDH